MAVKKLSNVRSRRREAGGEGGGNTVYTVGRPHRHRDNKSEAGLAAFWKDAVKGREERRGEEKGERVIRDE